MLGPLQVRDHGRELAVPPGKPRTLLVLLALRSGEPVDRGELIAELWPEGAPATADKTLQVYVSRLRKLIPGDALTTIGAAYALRVAPGALDTAAFEAGTRSGREALANDEAAGAAAALRSALALWRGPALVDVPAGAFLRAEAARLDALRLAAIEDLTEAELRPGGRGSAFKAPGPSGPTVLLEREEDLSALRGLADRLRSDGTGGCALVEGAAGIGKTALLKAFLDEVRAAGDVTVLTARGHELEDGLAFGVVRQVLGPAVIALDDAGRAAALGGAARLAGPVLGLRDDPQPEVAAVDPLYGLFWLVANLAERVPLVVAIDDLHWLDPESSRFVAYLAARIEELPVLLVAGSRPPDARTSGVAAIEALRAGARVVRPQPLSAASAAVVVGGAAPAADAQRVTGGNPFLLVELRRALEQAPAGQPLDAVGAEPVARSVARRIARISPEAVALADAIAVFPSGTRLVDAAAVAGLELQVAATAADALVRAAVLQARDGVLELLHPMLRASLYDAMGPFQRTRAHASAARLLAARGAPVEQVVAHLLAGEPAGDHATVALLRAAAANAVASSAPRAAVRYLERADAEGAATGAEALDLMLALGRLQRLLDLPGARSTLQRAFDASRGTPRRAEATIELAAWAYSTRDDALVQRIAASAEDELDPDARLALDMLAAECAWNAGDRERCLRMLDRVPDDLPGDTAAQRAALLMVGSARIVRCDRVPGALELLRRACFHGGGGLVAGIDLSDPMGWFLLCGALPEAEALIEERLAIARRTGNEQLHAMTQRAIAWLLMLRGDLVGSIAASREGLAQAALPPLAAGALESNLVNVLVLTGDLDAAEALVQRLAAYPATWGLEVDVLQRSGELLHARGRYREAVGAFDRLHEMAEREGLAHPTAREWTHTYADCLTAVGRVEEAVALEQEMVARSDAIGSVQGAGLHRAALARATGDLDLHREAVAILAPSPFRWWAAKARLDCGAAQRRAGSRVEAREHLRLALAYADPAGALPIATAAREELALAGARPRTTAVTGAEALTPGETRVALLAAEGHANKEIAQELFLSVKTVEMTLVRAYRKLEIGSRRQLADALRGPEAR